MPDGAAALPTPARIQVAGESTLPNSRAAGCLVTQTARPAGWVGVGSARAVSGPHPGGGVPAAATVTATGRRGAHSASVAPQLAVLPVTLRAPTGNAGRGSSERSFSYEKRIILPNHDAA